MSVLIKSMDMPESCVRCRLRGGSFGTFCKALNEYIDDTRGVSRDKRMDNCPLVPIKMPHGRLIDADDLSKQILKWMPPDPCGQPEKEFPIEADIGVSMMMEIEESETVIEPEVQDEQAK